MKKRILKVISAVLAIAMLAGCGGQGGAKPEGAQNNGAPKAVDKIVTLGVSGTPDLDPAVATSGSSIIAMINMYDTLVYPGEDGMEGRLAEKWESSDDGLTYTFHLKKGVKFHNGEEVKASDVAFSMNRMIAIGEGYAYLYEDAVQEAKAIDDYTVEFKLKRTFGPFVSTLIRLAIISEKDVMANKKDGPYGEYGDYGKAYLTTTDAGSGAYKAKELVQQDYFYAEKNPDWFFGWKSEKAPEGFKMMAITEASTVRTMINNGELDITDQWQSAESLAAMDKIDGVSIAQFSTFLMYNMYYNTQLAPMDDVNYRRAISCLIDYDMICNSILIGSKPATGPVSANVRGHVDTSTFKFDPEKAKEYLAKSKYADTYKDYPIEIVCNSDVADLEKIALMIQSAASQIGITVEISKAPWVSIVDRAGSKETTPHMMAINSAPSYDEAGSYLESRYHSKTAGTWEQCEWLENDKVDKMIEDSLATVDEGERFKKYADIQKYIADELCPTGYLCDLTERAAYQSATLKWNAIENAKDGEISSALYGYLHVFSDMEIIG
ncbi:MAG: ABC transporter substrate-binding protein [Oscillospiraceae bacterium]